MCLYMLLEHLEDSINHVDALNLKWKKSLGHAGLVLLGYEGFLLLQLLPHGVSALSLALKLVALGSIQCMQDYVQSGHRQRLTQSLLFSSIYVLMWFYCSILRHTTMSSMEISPLCILYSLMSFIGLRLVGNNTKAEVARAQQLEKLAKQM